jgi:NAD(P)-dependent dehydrogenase (short-subunit alcohol dehydrogenase family)
MTRVALVTGGGRGLGRAFAIALAREGWHVSVASRNADELEATAGIIRSGGGRGMIVRGDVTVESDVRTIVAQTEMQLGPIDLLVNNAGMGPPFGPLLETPAAEWWRNIEVNLRGPMLCCHAAAKGMADRGHGRIINVASGAGTVSIPYLSAYVTGKAALIRFTEVLADELRGQGIAVFAIEPGTVRTAMAEQLLASEAGKRWLPWFHQIFEEGRDVSTAPGERLILHLASGRCDGLSGHFFIVAAPSEADRAEEIVARDMGLLRMQAQAGPG